MSEYKLVHLSDAFHLGYPDSENLENSFGYGIYLFENKRPVELVMTGKLAELEDALQTFYGDNNE